MSEERDILPRELDSVPPTCEIVFRVLLAADAPLTQKEIVSKTARPQSSIKTACQRLCGETSLVERRQSLENLNVFRYVIRDIEEASDSPLPSPE